ncbi:MAG: bifunctional RNase H/acid phosphatase [Frankiaceae bacterium]|nr:bifunctional RNase H/acid phosphatase [Frankiaceae bacterium]
MSRVVIEADGGSRGNPGPAGYGAVVRDASSGEVLREVAAGIGVASNNVAEYRGLIAGLEAAAELGAREVDVRMDSLLVVNQMSQKWKIKHEAMRPLASQAASLVRGFDRVTFTHIRREFNKHADRLANEAMDAAARGLTWSPRTEVPEPEPAPSSSDAPPRLGWSAPSGTPTTLLLLRHGETPLTPEKRFSGRGDPELSERGVAQAAAAAARLLSAGGIAAVVSSPLRRAKQTASAVAESLGVDVVVDEGFVETDFGAWEGLTFAEVRARFPAEMQAWLGDPSVPPPDGESLTETFARVTSARERVLASYPGLRVVVVSHVTPIKAMVREALGAPPQVVYRMHLDPASLTTIDWYADGPAVVTGLNDVSHL